MAKQDKKEVIDASAAEPAEVVEKIREAAKAGRIQFADSFKIDDYPTELERLLVCIGIKSGWFSDESSFGDFSHLDAAKYEALSALCKMEVSADTLLWQACASMRTGAN